MSFYYRMYRNGYLLDMSKFNRLTLVYKNSNNQIYSEVYTNTVVVNGEVLVEIKVPASLYQTTSKINITPTVRISNVTTTLKSYDLVIFEGRKGEMTAVTEAILRFNYMYGEYLKRIKRDQINKPNGIIGLDSNGRIKYEMLPLVVGNHPFETIRFNEVHGIRLNSKFMLEYYDTDDEEWYEANSIFGGMFGYPNKPSPKYDVFGGTWDTIQLLDVDGGKFVDNLSDAYDGGNFTDGTSSGIHAGSF